jgi:hypothetical protein
MRGCVRTAICNARRSTRARTPRRQPGARGTTDALEWVQMKDVVLIGVTVAFFALAWAYARGFDHL